MIIIPLLFAGGERVEYGSVITAKKKGFVIAVSIAVVRLDESSIAVYESVIEIEQRAEGSYIGLADAKINT